MYMLYHVSTHLFIALHSHGLVTSLLYEEGARLSNMHMTVEMFRKLCDRTNRSNNSFGRL